MAKFKARQSGRRCNFKKLTIGILISIIIFSLVSMAGSAVVYKVMFARRDLPPDTLEWRYCDIDSEKYPRKEYEFQSGDNTLRGYLYGCESEKGIIIIVHGIGGGADSHLSETLDFVDRGWAVFSFSGTGSRNSEGKSLVGFSQMNIDLTAAVSFVSSLYPDEPIMLYGHSMGAYASATVLDNFPQVKAAVLIAGFNQPVETMYYHAQLRLGPVVALEYPFLVLHNKLVFGDSANESALDAINSGDTPVLIVQGSEDDVVTDDISIYGKRNEITNPNASYLLADVPFRDRHSTVWRSQEAAEYYLKTASELDCLHREYGDPLSDHILKDFLENLDRYKLCELDKEFMDRVNSFYTDSISNSG